MWCPKNAQRNSNVIPGELALARPGIQKFQKHMDTGFRRYDGKEATDFVQNFSDRTRILEEKCQKTVGHG